ncbi:hypothetical protein ACJJTC_004918 [Scirpophaga incertulas]
MDSEKVVLNGQNWSVFKFSTIVKLKAKGVFSVVQNTKPVKCEDEKAWEEKDCKAQEIIVSRIRIASIFVSSISNTGLGELPQLSYKVAGQNTRPAPAITLELQFREA